MDTAINNVLIPDFRSETFFSGSIGIQNGRIAEISDAPLKATDIIEGNKRPVSPGLIDCHCHIESSFLTPLHFGNTVALCGTLHVVADCHEIANVAGRPGLEFFMDNSKGSACHIMFAVPSCVPATPFATSGGRLDLEDIILLLEREDVAALGELMNVPGVLARDSHFMQMIREARKRGKRVNGHAPALHGSDLEAYVNAGVDDDHESESFDELEEKIAAGLHVFIREGSAEHSEPGAYRVIDSHAEKVSFCTDDKSVNDILDSGHINFHLRKAVSAGIAPIKALKAASFTGLDYYGLDEYAEIRPGAHASMVLFDNLENFHPDIVLSHGRPVTEEWPESSVPAFIRNSFRLDRIRTEDVPPVPAAYAGIAIGVEDGSLVTRRTEVENAAAGPDLEHDLVKLAVFERYGHGHKSACLIKGTGLRNGAFASSVAHDCHNIIVCGVDDESIASAANLVLETGGGLAAFANDRHLQVALETGGIVSDTPPTILAGQLRAIRKMVHQMGSTLADPFATLSFMALEVIPHLKLTDKGLFNVDKFSYI